VASNSRRTLIVAIVVIVIVLCLCLCCAAVFGGAEFYAGSVLTATASAPTATPEATNTPVPTFTRQPTATPVPTVTPTLNPLGHLSPDEQKYVLAFQDQSQRWAESRKKYDTLMASPKPTDANWKAEVTAALSAWKGLASQARGLAAAGKFEPAKQKYLTAVQHFDSAADLATAGVSNQDVVAFDQSKEEIKAGDAALAEARTQADTLKKP